MPKQTTLKGEIVEVDEEIDEGALSRPSIPYATIQIECEDGHTSDLEIPARLLPDGAGEGDELTITIERGE